MSYLVLPPEILFLIARQLETEKDITSLMRTSARNYQLHLSFLYEHNVEFHSGEALISCVDDDNETEARLLLKSGADVTEIDGFYPTDSELLPDTPVGPLHFVRSETMTELLIENGADVGDSPSQWGTPLHAAAERGDIAVAKFLLENGADVNEPNARVATPLHIAANQGHLDMARFLLDNGANINSCDTSARCETCDYYEAPLHFACSKCSEADDSMIKLLLERGADSEARDIHSATPLHAAAAGYNLPSVKLLFDYGAPVNVRDERGTTPLFMAAEHPYLGVMPDPIERPDLDIAKLLLEQGALVNIQNRIGVTPLFMAVDHMDSAMAKLLLDHGALVGGHYREGEFRSPLHHAAIFGVVATVELLISHGAEVNEQDEYGQACLQLVINHPNPGMVKLLLDHGALVDLQDNSGSTSLHDVVEKGSLTKEDLLLLKQGVEIKVEDDPEGNSNKYMLERRREDLADAKLLLDYGFDFNILDNKGKSALDYAAENKEVLAPTLIST
ncbi:hypothetical protein VE02_00982 [Pseudogymnoascus sp. 03VT05]|nr:hypothetical protein VE02_00982 [Pseudogymnoascus sp. 03VT05]